jgi:glycosidase
MIAAAHAAGIRVLLDVVPNHVYEDSPRLPSGIDDRWFNFADPPCVCGLGSCDWGPHPDLLVHRLSAGPAAAGAGGAAGRSTRICCGGQRRFEVDGLRVDAVPMMPRAATRRMAHELRLGVQGESPFLIGEVFTGAGAWGVDVIRYYLGPDGLDSVFDFPLMWVIRDAVAHESAGFDAVEAMLEQVETATAGSGAVLGQMLGNHDVTRFFSEAHGDAGGDPWAAPAEQAEDARAFARMRTGLTLLLTLPGLPVLFYGDEIGLAGANDPDNRRVLPDWDALSPEQLATRSAGAAARDPATLPAGAAHVAHGGAGVEDRLYVYMRGEGEALVLLSSAAEATMVAVPAELAPGEYVDVLTRERIMVDACGRGARPRAATAAGAGAGRRRLRG